MRLTSGSTEKIKFKQEKSMRKEDGERIEFKVEQRVDNWGVFRSMEIGVRRNGKPADDVAIRNMGVKESNGQLILSFDLCDETKISTGNYTYAVDATISFYKLDD